MRKKNPYYLKKIIFLISKGRAEKFSMWDPNILFLLTYPQRELEISDKVLIPVRKAEIMIAAKLIGLNQICCAEDYHLRSMRMKK